MRKNFAKLLINFEKFSKIPKKFGGGGEEGEVNWDVEYHKTFVVGMRVTFEGWS